MIRYSDKLCDATKSLIKAKKNNNTIIDTGQKGRRNFKILCPKLPTKGTFARPHGNPNRNFPTGQKPLITIISIPLPSPQFHRTGTEHKREEQDLTQTRSSNNQLISIYHQNFWRTMGSIARAISSLRLSERKQIPIKNGNINW